MLGSGSQREILFKLYLPFVGESRHFATSQHENFPLPMTHDRGHTQTNSAVTASMSRPLWSNESHDPRRRLHVAEHAYDKKTYCVDNFDT